MEGAYQKLREINFPLATSSSSFSLHTFFFFLFFFLYIYIYIFIFSPLLIFLPTVTTTSHGWLCSSHRQVARAGTSWCQGQRGGRWRSCGKTTVDVASRRHVEHLGLKLSSHFSANSSGLSKWSRWFWNPHDILSKMTPSFPSFIAKKISTFSHVNGTSNLDLNQTGPYFEVPIPNPYSWWKMLRFNIYGLCLVPVAKSNIFRDKLWKLSV